MSTQQSQEQTEQAMVAAQETGTDPAVVAAAASVVLSWYYFFVKGDRERGIFVGLWPPTIFAFVSYFQQTRMRSRLDSAMGRSTSSGVRDTVERIVGAD